MPEPKARRWLLAGATAVVLVLAGMVPYLADSDPDGLESVLSDGCTTGHEGQLQGTCLAQHADESAVAGSPFADYTFGGDAGLTGVAGVAGALVVLAVGGTLFWLLRRRAGDGRSSTDSGTGT